MQSALSLRRPASVCCRGVSAGARQARPLALRVNAIAVGDMLPSFELQTDDKSFLKSQVRNTGPEGFSVQDALHAQQSVTLHRVACLYSSQYARCIREG